MKESIWGYAVFVLGIIAIVVIWFFMTITNTDQHNYNLLKETVEAAMYDALDLSAYREDGTIKIIEEKFVENFIRRFAENASLANTYRIDIYDINEEPPKVSLKVSSVKSTQINNYQGDIVDFNFDVVNNIDAILETKYTSDCSSDNPCYYYQEYVALPGTGFDLNGEYTDIKALRKPSIFNSINNNDELSVSIADVVYTGLPASDSDISKYFEHADIWYSNITTPTTSSNDFEINNLYNLELTGSSFLKNSTTVTINNGNSYSNSYKVQFSFKYKCFNNNRCNFGYKYIVKWKYYRV